MTRKLKKNQVFAPKGHRLVVRCFQGIMWITYKNGKDHILNPGEKIELTSLKKPCICALTDGMIEITA